jgi:hypothetical protein
VKINKFNLYFDKQTSFLKKISLKYVDIHFISFVFVVCENSFILWHFHHNLLKMNICNYCEDFNANDHNNIFLLLKIRLICFEKQLLDYMNRTIGPVQKKKK